MKILSTAVVGILAMGVVAHADAEERRVEGRYKVYNVRMHGTSVGVQENKGKVIDNGEVHKIDRVRKESGEIFGYLIDDNFAGWQWFLSIEKGGYNQSEASLEVESRYNYQRRVEEEGRPFSYTENGLAQFYLEIEAEDVVLRTIVMGYYFESMKEVWKSGSTNEVYKFNFSGTGAGLGESGGGFYGPTIVRRSFSEMGGVYVRNSKVKYNKTLSHLLSEAYAEEYANSENEELAVIAVEEALNGFINRKAKIDDADFELYFDD